jgi:hypothetical protein
MLEASDITGRPLYYYLPALEKDFHRKVSSMFQTAIVRRK